MKKGRKDSGDEEGSALWRRVAETVTPYHAPPAPRRGKAAQEKQGIRPAAPVEKPAPARAAQKQNAAAGFDAATHRRLKKGQMAIEGTLDLHGMTQAGAHAALNRFIARARRAGWRNLLVITGKGGLKTGGGVLRRLLPLWLQEEPFRTHVIACATARQKDGGDGAYYLRLRKPQ